MALETKKFDAATYLDSPEAIQAFLEDALTSTDPTDFIHALGIAARAQGMSSVARTANLGRESLYKALSENGNPEFVTVSKVVSALGLKLSIAEA